MLFAVSVAIVVVASLTSPPQQSDEQISGLTYGALTARAEGEIRATWGKPDVLGTVIVLGLVVGFYLYFSFWL